MYIKVRYGYHFGEPSRFLAQRLQEVLGQPFVVENRPGAGAQIGTQMVAKAAPDGYTLLVMSNTHTVNETLVPNRPYNLTRDFVPVAPINDAPLVLVANETFAAKSLKELIEAAKQAPGKLNYASSGTGTPYHIAGELLNSMAGIKVQHVPYKSSGQARTAVVGGEVNYMFDAIATMAQLVQANLCARWRPRARSARRCCPTCRPWRRQACQVIAPTFGLACWRLPVRHGKSSRN